MEVITLVGRLAERGEPLSAASLMSSDKVNHRSRPARPLTAAVTDEVALELWLAFHSPLYTSLKPPTIMSRIEMQGYAQLSISFGQFGGTYWSPSKADCWVPSMILDCGDRLSLIPLDSGHTTVWLAVRAIYPRWPYAST